MKVQVTSSKRTRGPKRMEMLLTESITFQLYRRFGRELSGDEQRLEKDNAETQSFAERWRQRIGLERGHSRDWVRAPKAAPFEAQDKQDRRTPNWVLKVALTPTLDSGIRVPSGRSLRWPGSCRGRLRRCGPCPLIDLWRRGGRAAR